MYFFQILLSGRKVGGSSIVEAVSQYLSDNKCTGEASGTSSLKRLCVPANIFLDSDGCVINRLFEEVWNKACAAGFELLDVARGKSLTRCTEIHDSLLNLLEETRTLLFSTGQMKSESTASDSGNDPEKLAMIRRIVSEMIISNRVGVQQKPFLPPDDRFDEVVETVILRSAPPSEPLIAAKPSMDADATVIIPNAIPVQERILELTSVGEEELLETVVLSSRRFTQQAQEEPSHQRPSPAEASAQQQAFAKPSQEQNDLCETVMISSPSGRQRPGGGR
jgi:hypothetical protein